MQADIKEFRMPRFNEVPDLGLYLDQTAKYINGVFSPLGCVEVTTSMVSNYVKKRYIGKPVRKLYSRVQLIELMFIALTKLVLPMDNVDILLKKAEEGALRPSVYDDFCERFEDILKLVFYGDPLNWELDEKGGDSNRFAVSLLIAISHCIYLNDHFNKISGDPAK